MKAKLWKVIVNGETVAESLQNLDSVFDCITSHQTLGDDKIVIELEGKFLSQMS